MTIIKGYSRIALALGFAFTVPFNIALSGPPMADGVGAGVLVALLALAAAILLFLHALGVILVFAGRSRALGATRELRWHVAALVLMAAVYIVSPQVIGPIAQARREPHIDPMYTRLLAAVASGQPMDAGAWARQLDTEGRYALDGLVSAEVDELRLDKVQLLEASGITVVHEGDVAGWAKLVRTAAKSDQPAPAGARAAMLRWLLAQGDRFGYSLHGQTGDLFFSGGAGFDLVKAWGDTGLFDLLVAHGADVNECSVNDCPLWDAAQDDDAARVALLLSHGADVAPARGRNHTTALGEAIRSGDVASVKLLLAAGAKATFDERHDDVVAACVMQAAHEPEIVAQLHAAQVRITAERLYAARSWLLPPELSPSELACARGFVDAASGRAAPGASAAPTPRGDSKT